MADPNNINGVIDFRPKQKVTAKEFAAKYRSKREIYNFLSVEVGVYLPHFDQVTIYFCKCLFFLLLTDALIKHSEGHHVFPQEE